MERTRLIRYALIGALLLLGIIWSMAEARQEMKSGSYPESGLMVSAKWLRQHHDDEGMIIVDVRSEEELEQEAAGFIPNAVHLPWTRFRYHEKAYGIGDKFIGVEPAQQILGESGISRNSTVVLYDSIERDGGATASYLFWVLDLLGHDRVHLLEQGIEAWVAAGGTTTAAPRRAEPVLYQALTAEIRIERKAAEDFIYERLGDSQYNILDVRSREEYLGETPNLGLTGSVLKLGHIPTAVNVDYRFNWDDAADKKVKSYRELQELYRGFDPSLPVIVYCHSGRRSSFTYFILRLMGFAKVILYENSWNGWGRHHAYYPVETRENRIKGTFLPGSGAKLETQKEDAGPAREGFRNIRAAKGGYVSCGG